MMNWWNNLAQRIINSLQMKPALSDREEIKNQPIQKKLRQNTKAIVSRQQLFDATKYSHDEGDFGPNEVFPFLALPRELQLLTMCLADVSDVINLSLASKDLYELSKNESVWKSLCYNKWTDIKGTAPEWRKYFYHRTTFLAPEHCNVFQCKVKDVAANDEPSARQSLTGCYINGKVVYIGGQTSVVSRLDEIYYYDPVTRLFSKPAIKGNPPKFARHTAANIGSKIYVFGGYDGVFSFFGLAVFDVETLTWSYPQVTGDTPIPRTNHAVTVVGHKMYLFGGNDTTNRDTKHRRKYGTYGDFFVLDAGSADTLKWEQPQTKGKTPCARSGHHMETVGNKIFLYGGGLWDDQNRTWIERYNDMYMFNTVTNEWSEVPQSKVPVNAFISVPHWSVGSYLFVYSDQLWCFDTVSNTWNALKFSGQKPQKRFLGPATFVTQPQNSVYLFGGVYNTVLKDLTQITWTQSITQMLTHQSNMNS